MRTNATVGRETANDRPKTMGELIAERIAVAGGPIEIAGHMVGRF
jgi:hypothetical protein